MRNRGTGVPGHGGNGKAASGRWEWEREVASEKERAVVPSTDALGLDGTGTAAAGQGWALATGTGTLETLGARPQIACLLLGQGVAPTGFQALPVSRCKQACSTWQLSHGTRCDAAATTATTSTQRTARNGGHRANANAMPCPCPRPRPRPRPVRGARCLAIPFTQRPPGFGPLQAGRRGPFPT